MTEENRTKDAGSKQDQGDEDASKQGEREDQQEKSESGGDKKQKPPPKWPFVVAGLVVAVFAVVVLVIIFAPRPDVWTDDAYTTVHYASVAPRVSGKVKTISVNDNQIVRAGDLLVQLDPRDYEASVAMAQATLDRDRARAGEAAANVARQPALILEQEATVSAARARLAFSRVDQQRYANLATTGAGSGQQLQQTTATLQQDTAAFQAAQASLEASRRQLEVLQQQRAAAEGTVRDDEARLNQANLNLSYTHIVAPVDGMVGQRKVETGNIVSPGKELMVVVPLNAVYVLANYLETDLRHVRVGQHVTVHVDAYDLDLDGIVDSVAPATGATFEQIPPNNATGNFTKIVQRLPVKVVVGPNQPRARLLRVGFSVETTIHTGLADVADTRDGTRQQPVTGR